MFSASSPAAPGTSVGDPLSGTPSTSSKLEAGSVDTSNTRRPASANPSATADDVEVFPTPPLPVKNKKRGALASNPPSTSKVIDPTADL
jgi:hypothetical protein